jgi:hypothetical protein
MYHVSKKTTQPTGQSSTQRPLALLPVVGKDIEQKIVRFFPFLVYPALLHLLFAFFFLFFFKVTKKINRSSLGCSK